MFKNRKTLICKPHKGILSSWMKKESRKECVEEKSEQEKELRHNIEQNTHK